MTRHTVQFKVKNIAGLFLLCLITFAVTAFLFFSLSHPSRRGEPFYMTLSVALFLELLVYSYGASFFLPLNLKTPIHLAVGVVLGIYVVLSITTMLIFNLAQGVLSTRFYPISLVVEGALFLLVIGSVLMLNFLRQEETDQVQEDKEIIKRWLADLELASSLLSQNSTLKPEEKSHLSRELTLLKEKIQFSPPYGETQINNTRLVGEWEQEIQKLFVKLKQPSESYQMYSEILSGLRTKYETYSLMEKR